MAEPAPHSQPSARRARWGTISREDVINAAVRIVRAGGYEQMSIRSLAADLGVAPMALYRHIRDKDDLLDEVTDVLLAEVWRPAADEADWQAWLVEAAARLRAFLVSQPAALHVYLSHPVVSPAAIDRMEAMMSVMRQAGADEQAARRGYGALHTYTIGFAALEASRADWVPDGAEIGSLAQELAAYTTTEQFMQGLHYLLEGISRHAGTDSPFASPGTNGQLFTRWIQAELRSSGIRWRCAATDTRVFTTSRLSWPKILVPVCTWGIRRRELHWHESRPWQRSDQGNILFLCSAR
jgi:TetR/AcrR family transcriptional regulator, tetracycline repressor protein